MWQGRPSTAKNKCINEMKAVSIGDDKSAIKSEPHYTNGQTRNALCRHYPAWISHTLHVLCQPGPQTWVNGGNDGEGDGTSVSRNQMLCKLAAHLTPLQSFKNMGLGKQGTLSSKPAVNFINSDIHTEEAFCCVHTGVKVLPSPPERAGLPSGRNLSAPLRSKTLVFKVRSMDLPSPRTSLEMQNLTC